MTRNNNSIYFKDWTTKKLRSEAKEYHRIINNPYCGYGTGDVRIYYGLLDELSDRGIELQTQLV